MIKADFGSWFPTHSAKKRGMDGAPSIFGLFIPALTRRGESGCSLENIVGVEVRRDAFTLHQSYGTS
jgi:hypothetical protein